MTRKQWSKGNFSCFIAQRIYTENIWRIYTR